MIQFRNNKILLLGDTHSYMRTYHLLKITKNIDGYDVVFLGDGGEGFSCDKQDEIAFGKISDLCRKRNINLFCIRGNHSNPEVWNRNYKFSNVFLVKDYESARFPGGKTALLVGGGISIDRVYRKENLDYWPDEITLYQKINEKFDILFSHDCPDYFNNSTGSLPSSPYGAILAYDPTLMRDALFQRNVMGQIVADIECKNLYSGHFHRSVVEHKFGMTYRGLNIEEIFLLDVNNLDSEYNFGVYDF